MVHVHICQQKTQTYKKMDRCNKKGAYNIQEGKCQISDKKLRWSLGQRVINMTNQQKASEKNTDGKTACCLLYVNRCGEEIRIAKGVWVLDRLPSTHQTDFCSKHGWLTKGILPREMSGVTTLSMDG